MKNTRGFSLIELMIAVAIVGVLVAIAYPSYQNSLIKGSRGSAKTVLMEVAQKEQALLLDQRSYVPAANCAALEAAPLGVGSDAMADVKKYYTCVVTAPAGNPPTFTATLTPIPGKRMKDDGPLSINEKGEKTPAGKW